MDVGFIKQPSMEIRLTIAMQSYENQKVLRQLVYKINI